MKFGISLYTFLVFCHTRSHGYWDMLATDPNNCANCRQIGREQIEPLKRVAMIKAEILRRLGIGQPPTMVSSPPPIPIRLPEKEVKNKEPGPDYSLSDILSYSEAPDNFTDENIVQFRLSKGNSEKELVVKNANLLIRVKCMKKRNKSQKDAVCNSKKRKKRRSRKVDLVISTVNAKGRRGEVIASVKSKLKKTKWLKVNLPHEIVQQAIDSQNKTLQIYIQCVGCGKGARLILVHKRRKRRNAVNKSKLHKRRPMLFLHTSVATGKRVRRSAHVRQCDANSGSDCCKSNFVVDFESREFGWENWIISPRRYRTAFCEGICRTDNASSQANDTRACAPTRTRPLYLTYYNGDGAILRGVLPNMIVTKCGCL